MRIVRVTERKERAPNAGQKNEAKDWVRREMQRRDGDVDYVPKVGHTPPVAFKLRRKWPR